MASWFTVDSNLRAKNVGRVSCCGSEETGQPKMINPTRIKTGCELLVYLDTNEVVWFEIVGRAAAPVHNVLVLTFTP